MPVYRYFLFGGLDRLRLSARMVCGLLVAAGVSAALGAGLKGRPVPEIAAAGVAAAIVATLTAALVARWLGRRAALAAATISIAGSSAGVCDPGGWCEPLGVAAAVAAVAVFALAELPARIPPIPRKWAASGFYLCVGLAGLLTGSGALAIVAVVCLGDLAACQQSRALRFFADRRGLTTLAVAIAAWAAIVAWSEDWTASQWFGPLGESPAALTASIRREDPAAIGFACLVTAAALVVAGLVRAGHVAGGYGALMASWLAGPLLLAVCGAIPRSLAIAAIAPALSAVAAPLALKALRLAGSTSRRGRPAARFRVAARPRIRNHGSSEIAGNLMGSERS